MILSIRSDFGAKSLAYGIQSNVRTLYQALERMSSGRRINRASDDPAGLVISKQLQGQIGAIDQELSGISASIGKYNTASSAVGQMRDQLNDLRSLAVGAANSALNDESTYRAYQTTADSMVASYNETIDDTQFAGASLLTGGSGVTTIDHLGQIDLSSAEAAAASIETIDQAAGRLDQALTDLGATQRNDLASRQRSLEITRQNLIAAESALADTDYALEFSNATASMIRSQAAIALMSHSFVKQDAILNLFSRSR